MAASQQSTPLLGGLGHRGREGVAATAHVVINSSLSRPDHLPRSGSHLHQTAGWKDMLSQFLGCGWASQIINLQLGASP